MWISKKKLHEMQVHLGTLQNINRLAETKLAEYQNILSRQSAHIYELTSAHKGLVALCKARKEQLRDVGVTPIGLDDLAELQQYENIEELIRRIGEMEVRLVALSPSAVFIDKEEHSAGYPEYNED